MVIMDLFKKFIESNSDKKSKTLILYHKRLSPFFDLLSDKQILHLNELSSFIIQDYMNQIRQKGYSVNTVYSHLNTLKSFLRFIYENSYSLVDLSYDIQLPRWERRIRKNYSLQEIDAMINHTVKNHQITRRQAAPHFIARNKAILAVYFYEKLKIRDLEVISTLDLDFLSKEIRLIKQKKFKKVTFKKY